MSISLRSRARGAAAIIALSTLLTMSVWFSATFVLPQLEIEWGLSDNQSTLLTIAVQAGFVVGALGSTASGLADALQPRTLMLIGGFGAACCNLALLWCDGMGGAFPARLGTGLFLALVYPSALKEVSSWFQVKRGTALGLMIGALTLGSALPHLVSVIGGLDWRVVITSTSVLSLVGALSVLAVRGCGPYTFPRGHVSFAAGFRSMRNRKVAMANIGYAGHMWELYGMWVWIGAFFLSLPGLATSPHAGSLGHLFAFLCIGVGAVGCLVGGVLSDRWGRASSALISLVCSGTAALVLALTYRFIPLWAVVAICAFWGFWVIADSAQFSAMVSENAPSEAVGGALSLQLAMGYLATIVSLWLMPQIVSVTSWAYALAMLALGPAVGAIAMFVAVAERSRSMKKMTLKEKVSQG